MGRESQSTPIHRSQWRHLWWTAGTQACDLTHFTSTRHPYQVVHARTPPGQPNGSTVTFKMAQDSQKLQSGSKVALYGRKWGNLLWISLLPLPLWVRTRLRWTLLGRRWPQGRRGRPRGVVFCYIPCILVSAPGRLLKLTC